MKKYPVEMVRNVALIAHGGAGKTSLAEAMLFTAGTADRLGRVDEGNSVMDHDPEEIRRKVSISLGIAPLEWKGHKLNLLDTPGYFDFVGDVKAALRVVEGALVLVDAVAGVEVGTELVWQYAEAARVPRMIVINKLDRENANFAKALASLENAFGRGVLAVQVPIGAQADFKGLVDVVRQKAYIFSGRDVKEEAVPDSMAAQVEAYREKLIEAAAEADDDLTMKYLEEGTLSDDDLILGLKEGVRQGRIMPVLCGSGLRNMCTPALLDAIVDLIPSPADAGALTGTDPRTGEAVERAPRDDAPFAALVFKTTADPFVGRLTIMRVYSGTARSDSAMYNVTKEKAERVGGLFIPRGKGQEAVVEAGPGDIVAVAKLTVTGTNDTMADEARPIQLEPVGFPAPVYSVAVMPKAKGDEEKIGSGLTRLMEEDPTFTAARNPITNEMIISGMGDLHLDVMVDRLKRKFGVDSLTQVPKMAYKETIRGSAKAEHKHKKQSGGRGQYGHCSIEIEPLYEGQDFEFVDRIFAGAIPINYRPAVEKGVRETMVEGVLAGYPVTGIRCTLLDGSYHDVDSSEMAFKIAGSQAFKKAFTDARPILLEPIMQLEVRIPDSYMGDIMGDLNKKRARIMGMEPVGSGMQVVKAMVPQSELARYAIDVRSITQGRGTFTMQFDHYEEMPAAVAQPIITAAQAARQAEAQ